jgi:hypothetical protein
MLPLLNFLYFSFKKLKIRDHPFDEDIPSHMFEVKGVRGKYVNRIVCARFRRSKSKTTHLSPRKLEDVNHLEEFNTWVRGNIRSRVKSPHRRGAGFSGIYHNLEWRCPDSVEQQGYLSTDFPFSIGA